MICCAALLCSVLTHLILFTTVIVMYIFVFNWENPVDPPGGDTPVGGFFQWHPVLMVTAFVLCMGEALIAYRILPFEHRLQKTIHGIFMALAVASSAVGLWMIVSYHNQHTVPIDNFYNIHGILGLTTLVLFYTQWLGGFLTFVVSWMIPSFPKNARALAMPYHRFVGVVLFVMCWASMLTGLLDRQRIQGDDVKPPHNMVNYSHQANTGNAAGLLIVLSGVTILYHFSPVSKVKDDSDLSARLLP